jgi:deoxyribodipyrimidine photo-lyase
MLADLKINIVWFKRDLRIQDHAPLYEATQKSLIEKNILVLPVFSWDESVWSSPDYSQQHVAFVRECLLSLKQELQSIALELFEANNGILNFLDTLSRKYSIVGLYSHEETGNQCTYALDKAVALWCKHHQVPWHEYPQNGVVRRLKNRDHWNAIWEKRMALPQVPIPSAHSSMQSKLIFLELNNVAFHIDKPQSDKPLRQKGGRELALKTLHSFLNGRASKYRGGISSPLSSVDAGSRISPYLSWGVLSMKEVIQALRAQRERIKQMPNRYPKNLDAGLKGFESRLHWHCHFMQKLESEPEIEYRSMHSGFNGIRDEAYADVETIQKLARWKTGQTGWPLVDACMVMLKQTGWINFRMRAMLISTASYLYWLHWRETGLHLAREFLDYEPGIHWPQVQMQSGTTGINTLRIYNPIKQARDQDPEGKFVRQWLPALKNVPNAWIFEPWLMTPELQQRYGCVIGQDYPAPISSVEVAIKTARAKIAIAKQATRNSQETRNIVQKHASRKTNLRTVAKKTTSASAPSSSEQIKQQDLFQ